MIEPFISEKQCSGCRECKPVTEFSAQQSRCKACRRAYGTAAYHSSPKARASRANRDKPTSWILPRDARPVSDRLLDLELRRWGYPTEAANDLFWRVA